MVERSEAVNAVDARFFETLRPLCQSGSVLAVLEGLNWCQQHEVAPPAWFLVVAAQAINRLLLGTGKKVGRAASGLNSEREALKRYLRWELVHEAERGRGNFRHEDELLKANTGVRGDRQKRHVREVLDKVGRNQDDVFAYVSWQVEGTPLAGGPDAIRASYRRVERDMRSAATAARYYPYSPQAMRDAGMMDLLDPVPAKKWPAFFGWES